MKKIDLVLQGSYNNYTAEIALSYLNLEFVNRIIISCWEQDVVPNLHEKIVIVKSSDVHNPGVGNRNRQIKSSLEGLKKVNNEFSVKLRSDQKISLHSMRLMYEFYERYQEQDLFFTDGTKPKNRICVAGIFRPFPFHPRDHIFWGNTQDLISVFDIPHDETSLNDDYNQYLRAEAYICMWYYAKFDVDIMKYVANPAKYLIDGAPNIQEALVKSDYWGPRIFKPFPRIDFEWPKHGLKNYHYDLTATKFGEYWDN